MTCSASAGSMGTRVNFSEPSTCTSFITQGGSPAALALTPANAADASSRSMSRSLPSAPPPRMANSADVCMEASMGSPWAASMPSWPPESNWPKILVSELHRDRICSAFICWRLISSGLGGGGGAGTMYPRERLGGAGLASPPSSVSSDIPRRRLSPPEAPPDRERALRPVPAPLELRVRWGGGGMCAMSSSDSSGSRPSMRAC
mmetsp:Transcript_8672/g.21663  ORF Transcript_8672/g.21663 Transcript_8672/m.21663 type:complete len:204 (+) Transcript_8672:829-1440(+)